MNYKKEWYIFFACVFMILTKCQSRTDLTGADKKPALVDVIGTSKKVLDIDAEQKMLNSDFQKFVREAGLEQKTLKIQFIN